MVKLVDTLVSGTSERELVEVRVLFQAKSALLSMGFSQSLKEYPSPLTSRRWKRTRTSEEGGPTDQGGRIARMAIQPSQAAPEGGARTATTEGFRVLFQAKNALLSMGFSQSLKEYPSPLTSRRWKRTRTSEEGGPTDQGGRIARMAIQPSQAAPEGGARTATTEGFRVLFQAKNALNGVGFSHYSPAASLSLVRNSPKAARSSITIGWAASSVAMRKSIRVQS